jgi:hypothetical protein
VVEISSLSLGPRRDPGANVLFFLAEVGCSGQVSQKNVEKIGGAGWTEAKWVAEVPVQNLRHIDNDTCLAFYSVLAGCI